MEALHGGLISIWGPNIMDGINKQCHKVRQNWKGAESFDICFCVILGTSTGVLFLVGRLGAMLYLHPFLTFFQHFLIS